MKYFASILICSVLGIFSCTVIPQLTPLQKQQISTKTIYGAYEDTYRAILTVLQNQNFMIKNTDLATGLIVADVYPDEKLDAALARIKVGAAQVNKIELSCIVNKTTDSQTEIRINIELYRSPQEWPSMSAQNYQQMFYIEFYKNLFEQIEFEVKSRQVVAGTLSQYKNEKGISRPEPSPITLETLPNPYDESYFPDSAPQKKERKEKPIFIDIVNIAKDIYIMVHSTKKTPMKLNDNYKIVNVGKDGNFVECGSAKVIQIKDNKVALQYTLIMPYTAITKEFKLRYK